MFRKEGLCALATSGDRISHQCGGLYPALVDFQESEMRTRSDQLVFSNESRSLFPIQYPEVVGNMDQCTQSVCPVGRGSSPGRGIQYNLASSPAKCLIAEKPRKEFRGRRLFVRSAKRISLGTRIEAAPRRLYSRRIPTERRVHIIARLRTCAVSTWDFRYLNITRRGYHQLNPLRGYWCPWPCPYRVSI